jgi:hypothetical protein
MENSSQPQIERYENPILLRRSGKAKYKTKVDRKRAMFLSAAMVQREIPGIALKLYPGCCVSAPRDQVRIMPIAIMSLLPKRTPKEIACRHILPTIKAAVADRFNPCLPRHPAYQKSRA